MRERKKLRKNGEREGETDRGIPQSAESKDEAEGERERD